MSRVNFFFSSLTKQMCKMPSRGPSIFLIKKLLLFEIDLISVLYMFYDLHEWSLDDVAQLARWGNLRSQRFCPNENQSIDLGIGLQNIEQGSIVVTRLHGHRPLRCRGKSFLGKHC